MKYIIIATLALALAACAPAPAPTPPPAPQATAVPAATAVPPPTDTPTQAPVSTQALTQAPTRQATRTKTPTPAAAPVVGPVPDFSHIYVIVMENKEYGSIIGDKNAPYINSLIDDFALASNYTGIAHPSQPNYIALFSGSTQGVTSDSPITLNAPNLADQLEAKGKTWKVFAQNVPLNCYAGETAKGGEDGTGTYARKHDPAISFTSVSTSPARCGNITNFSHFDPAAANFELILPNMCNVMHDCPVSAGDSFLKDFVPKILNSAAWQQGGVLFLTWDEGSTNKGGGGHIPTIVISKNVTPGFKSNTSFNHYSLLRTIEDAWGLGCLENSCTASNLGEFFSQK